MDWIRTTHLGISFPKLGADETTHDGSPLVVDEDGFLKKGNLSYSTGSFTPTFDSGYFSTTQTALWEYTKIGNLVILSFPDTFGTSNGNSNKLHGFPDELLPKTHAVGCAAGRLVNNGVEYQGLAVIGTYDVMDLYFASTYGGGLSNSTYTTSGTKGIGGGTLVYRVN